MRLLAVGPNDTLATDAQLEDQAALLKEAMLEGAIGMSSGLTYTPGSVNPPDPLKKEEERLTSFANRMYASYTELVYLCKTLADSFPGAFYAPHHRSYGKNAMEAFKEMLDLGRATGIPVHLTHCKLNYEENVGRSGELLAMVDETIADGVVVTLDSYPYTPGSTTLASMLPSWANQGGPAETLERLRDRELREKIRYEMEECGCGQSFIQYQQDLRWLGLTLRVQMPSSERRSSGTR